MELSATQLFIASSALSALAALGSYYLSDKPLTARLMIGTVLFHGSLGGSLAIFAHEKYAWKQASSLALAGFYGGGVVQFSTLRDVAIKLLTHVGPSNAD